MKTLLLILFLPVLCFGQEQFMGFTVKGGQNGAGTIFLINGDGTGFEVVHHMNPATDGGENWGSPFLSDDGYCYGMANKGGQYDDGTIFRIKKDGSDFSVIKHFNRAINDGASPSGSSFIEDERGYLYATTSLGGTNNEGTIFRIKKDGTSYQVLRSLSKMTDGGTPQGGLFLHSDGNLYGTTQLGTAGTSASGGTIFKISTDGSIFNVIKYFDSSDPFSFVFQSFCTLISAQDGFLYGTTREGVKKGGTTGTRGSVFKVRTDGTEFSVIHHLTELDGQQPYGGLFLASNDYLYGMTVAKGEQNAGTIFRLNTDGTNFSVIKNFTNGTEGGFPRGALIEGNNGVLFGQTYGGDGLSLVAGTNGGAIFSVNQGGSGFKVLRLMNAESDGALARGNLVKVNDLITSLPRDDHHLSISLTPNPAHDIISLKTNENAIAHLFDIMGRTIAKFDVNSETLDLDVSNLPRGIYLISVAAGRRTKVERLVLN